MKATFTSSVACIDWDGPPKRYQTEAAIALTDSVGEIAHWAWIIAQCGNPKCIEPAHLTVHAPIRMAYPYGICVYCGRHAQQRDHLLPRNWTGDAMRHFVVTVPSCGTCNRVLGDSLTWSITERRAICHARLRRHFRGVLRTVDHTPEELDEYGPNLRQHIVESLAKKEEVLRMLAWPEDPHYDLRAFEKSGIENPYAVGLILPDGSDLDALVKAHVA